MRCDKPLTTQNGDKAMKSLLTIAAATVILTSVAAAGDIVERPQKVELNATTCLVTRCFLDYKSIQFKYRDGRIKPWLIQDFGGPAPDVVLFQKIVWVRTSLHDVLKSGDTYEQAKVERAE
jgi:hypothetical protein